ncbi:MAG: NAD(P)/FAD-dependent oxidoreductase, partial [Clostridiales bacterium]|nr:NAD(P)/FAD-dependent oxidoreductase [Clostridiales bacterium]
ALAILGGEVEGVELACLFSLLGYEVTLLEKEEEILPGNDADLVLPIRKALENQKVKIVTGVEVTQLQEADQGIQLHLSTGEKFYAPQVLLALGRKTNVPQGFEMLGIEIKDGFICVDEQFQTNLSHIYAIGDINGVHGMAHVALDQGRRTAKKILGERLTKPDYAFVPRAVFTLPELAGVGYQEMDCVKEGIPYKTGVAQLTHSYRGWSLQVEDSFVKVIVGEENQVLGMWFVGDMVSEMMGFAHYFISRKIRAEELIATLTIVPSLSQTAVKALEEAVALWEEERRL